MVAAIGSYHPSQIFRQKREDRAKGIETSAKKAETEAQNAENAGEPVRPEGLAGVLFDAASYLGEAEGGLNKISKKFDDMHALMTEALKLEIDDNDRKGIHKKFNQVKTELDQLAKVSQVKGDLLFSGKFSQKPKVIQIGNTEEEALSLRVNPLTADGLKLDRVRVDSLVNARKAQAQMEKTKADFTEVKNNIQSRSNTVEFKRRKIEEQEEEAKMAEKTSKGEDSEKEQVDPRYRYIRMQQEKVARAKGRDYGLLVNIRI